MRNVMILVVLAALGLGACSKATPNASSSASASSAVSTTPSSKETDVIAAKCAPDKKGHASLPKGFPKLVAVVFTASKKAGPSTIVSGYTPLDMDALDAKVKAAFSVNGFKLTHTEKDVHDAEVDFKGKKTTGQVKLNETCAGRTYITVTIRPA